MSSTHVTRDSNTHARRFLPTVIALGTAASIVFAVTTALHARVANADRASASQAMPVAHDRYTVQSSYNREQRYLGLIQAATRSVVGFEVPGAVEAILVDEGDQVAAGTPLARLDTKALRARRTAAAATVEQVAAELELAKARTERQSPLRSSGAISEQTYDDTRLAEKALASSLETAKAQLEAIDIDLEKSVLRAPYPALVGRRIVDRGAVTQPGAAVFSLVATTEREAHIGVAIEQSEYLRPGDQYPIQWRGQTIEAQLRAVRPDVNPVTMTTVAIFELPEGISAFDGEPVSVSLPRVEEETGGWIPLSALIEGERGVWTALAIRRGTTGTVTERAVVEVMHVTDDQAFVRGTLKDGDLIVADGVHRIAPGTLVSIDTAHDDTEGSTDRALVATVVDAGRIAP
ncbi:MAG: efflux RND transporter periplasmic adaptor subunit [Pseudomonadota bacterium]